VVPGVPQGGGDGRQGAGRAAVRASDTAPSPAAASGESALKAMDRQPRTTEVADSDEISDFGLPMPLALRLDGRGLEDVAWRKVLPGVAVRELALPPAPPASCGWCASRPARRCPNTATAAAS
jgi:hypothetical protein